MSDEVVETKRVSPTPKSELDYSMMTTDPTWGQSYIPKDLRSKLSKEYVDYEKFRDEQVLELDKIDNTIQQLLAQGFSKINDNILRRKTEEQEVIISIDRTTGKVVTDITNIILTKDGYWEILGYYNRDIRLGNLNDGSNPFAMNEVAYCEYHLNLAGDELNFYHKDLPNGFHKAFFAHIRRVASKIEVSHSKGGWFRKTGGTVRNEVRYEGVPPDAEKTKKFAGIPLGGGRTT